VIRDVMLHVLVSSAILALALLAAAWIRPLTARTRHAILVAGLLALVLPAPLLARLLERNDIAPLPVLTNVGTGFSPSFVPAALQQRSNGLKPVATLWAVVAAILLLRWWLVTRRLVTTALRAATAPPERTVRALEAARRRLNLRHSIDLIASPTCEAPAVVRVLRPMIILPADGCASLDDEELESLLCHECAHVARRDNLLGVIEAIACSVFWFNPLVWLAHRRIASAREAACDERVADAALRAETYVGALAKICRTLLAPRVPAVSCMASAHLKERIQHLMRYDSLRRSAFSHRTIAAASMLAVVLTVAAAGVVIAEPVTVDAGKYQLNYSMHRRADDTLDIRVQIVDTETKEAIAAPASVATKPGDRATVRVEQQTEGKHREFLVTIDPNSDGSGRMTMVVMHNGREVQNTSVKFPPPGARVARTYTGAPLSLNLANADIRDVMRVFAQITALEIALTPDVQGSVNVKVEGQPWDEAFDSIVARERLRLAADGEQDRGVQAVIAEFTLRRTAHATREGSADPSLRSG
jgi:beta-lactamase regulating signal transducer with metallopeptidase domain